MADLTFVERVEAARRLVGAMRAAQPTAPRHLLDQFSAAGKEAHRQVLVLGAVLEWSDHLGHTEDGEMPEEMAARLLIAARGLKPCPHLLRGGPQPAWARLALGRVDCGRCTATVCIPPPENADRCDWCGSHGHELFTPMAVQAGAGVFMGHACDECAGALKRFVGAA